MSLYQRIHEAQATPEDGGQGDQRDPVMSDLRQKVHHQLIDELGPVLYDKRLSEEELRRKVHDQLQSALAQERTPLSAADKAQLIQDVADDILGYGPIDRLLKDATVTEIMVNGPHNVFVERRGDSSRTMRHSSTTPTCAASSTRSCPRSVGGSTKRPRWSTLGFPTAPA